MTGSEALSSGRLTRHDLRTQYIKLHRNVYAPIDLELTALDRAFAAWLWSRGEATFLAVPPPPCSELDGFRPMNLQSWGDYANNRQPE